MFVFQCNEVFKAMKNQINKFQIYSPYTIKGCRIKEEAHIHTHTLSLTHIYTHTYILTHKYTRTNTCYQSTIMWHFCSEKKLPRSGGNQTPHKKKLKTEEGSLFLFLRVVWGLIIITSSEILSPRHLNFCRKKVPLYCASVMQTHRHTYRHRQTHNTLNTTHTHHTHNSTHIQHTHTYNTYRHTHTHTYTHAHTHTLTHALTHKPFLFIYCRYFRSLCFETAPLAAPSLLSLT